MDRQLRILPDKGTDLVVLPGAELHEQLPSRRESRRGLLEQRAYQVESVPAAEHRFGRSIPGATPSSRLVHTKRT